MFSLRAHAEQQFKSYLTVFPEERDRLVALSRQLAEDSGDVFIRSNMQGHITTSALVIDSVTDQVLIIHHRLFNRWLPPGGHHEGNGTLSASAFREANEETGLQTAALHPWHENHDAPFDIDTHPIQAQPSKNESAHVHHDFMYVLTADSGQPLIAQLSEVFAAKWISRQEFMAIHGLRFKRLAEKLPRLLTAA